ncbi:YfhO family protein [Butyrivibrio sp. CB08]|uniref:YfhO family protein n=1 Tax=Butyrivibrio sp. CB08 TaxID=2364879 RepID=UPI001314F7BF|nr:YfhO family protein [Butyrivibrio sp. CB08]
MYILAITPILVSRGLPFFYYGDYNVQQIPFYILAHRAVRSGEFFWNWNVDLGGSMAGDFSFYLWGSPFFWVTVLFPEGAIPYLMPFLMALKYGIAATTAYLYIRRYVNKYTYAMIGGYLYAFSGFNACNIVFNHFTDSVCFFPLYLILFEELMEEESFADGKVKLSGRKFIKFVVMTAFMSIINYYFFFGQVLFLVIYFLVRYVKCENIKEFLVRQGRFVLGIATGVLLAGFFLLPAFYGIHGNSRLSNVLTGYNMLIYPSGKLIWDIFKSLVMLPDIIGKGTLFYTTTVKNASLATYLPMFGIAGVIAFFLMNRKKCRWEKTLTIIFLVTALIPVLNSSYSLFNNSYYARWFYIPVLIMSLETVQVAERGRTDQLKKGAALEVLFFLFFSLLYLLPSTDENGEIEFFNMTENSSIFLRDVLFTGILVIFLIVAVFLLPKKRYIRDAIVLGLVIVSCVIATYVPVMNGSSIISDTGKEMWQEQMLFNKVEVDQSQFLRGEVDSTSTNYDMVWGIPSIHCFLSTVPSEVFDFLEGSAGITRTVETNIPVERAGIRAILSAKYYFENAVISKNRVYFNDEGTDGYVYVDTQDGFDIFENTNYIPMGFTYDNFITESEWEDLEAKEQDLDLARVLILSDEDAIKLTGKLDMKELTAEQLTENPINYYEFTLACKDRAKTSCESFETDTYGFSAVTSNIEGDRLLFFSVPNTEGFSCQVDGVKTPIYTADYGLMAIPVSEGVHNIRVTYTPEGRVSGIVCSIAALAIIGAYVVMLKKVKKND